MITPKDAVEAASKNANAVEETRQRIVEFMASAHELQIDHYLTTYGRVVLSASLPPQPTQHHLWVAVQPEVLAEIGRRYSASGWNVTSENAALTIEHSPQK